MRRTAILAVAVVLAGCSGPAPTPIIIYVTPAPTPTAAATPQPTATSPLPTPTPVIVTPEPSPTPVVHVAVAGDTLLAIAQKYGVTLAALLKANPQIKNPDRILVGGPDHNPCQEPADRDTVGRGNDHDHGNEPSAHRLGHRRAAHPRGGADDRSSSRPCCGHPCCPWPPIPPKAITARQRRDHGRAPGLGRRGGRDAGVHPAARLARPRLLRHRRGAPLRRAARLEDLPRAQRVLPGRRDRRRAGRHRQRPHVRRAARHQLPHADAEARACASGAHLFASKMEHHIEYLGPGRGVDRRREPHRPPPLDDRVPARPQVRGPARAGRRALLGAHAARRTSRPSRAW